VIDSKQASEALAEIDDIVQRVRQSELYQLASLAAVWWGVLVFAGNIATWLWPIHAGYTWVGVNAVGVAGLIALRVFNPPRSHHPGFEIRFPQMFVLFFAFGYICTNVIGHFGPRELGAFWPIYFMLFYVLAGLWFGYAFVAIGLGITALTLIGFFYIGEAFPLWMAFVNGGGLILGGLWMRRI